MKDYTKSDYALNKHSDGIVYGFDNGDTIVKVTLEDYLTENPDKTAQDFQRLKKISDKIYRYQDRAKNRQTNKNIALYDDTHNSACLSLEETYIKSQDEQKATTAYETLLASGTLTEKQKRRFIMHVIKGMTLRKVGEFEGVHFTSVDESVNTTIAKLKKIFEKM